MRRAFALAVLALSLLSVPSLPQEAPATGSIEGIVVRTDTDQPMANAQVTLSPAAAAEIATVSVTPGRYYLMAGTQPTVTKNIGNIKSDPWALALGFAHNTLICGSVVEAPMITANLRFAGLQTYSVSGSHTEGAAERRKHPRVRSVWPFRFNENSWPPAWMRGPSPEHRPAHGISTPRFRKSLKSRRAHIP